MVLWILLYPNITKCGGGGFEFKTTNCGGTGGPFRGLSGDQTQSKYTRLFTIIVLIVWKLAFLEFIRKDPNCFKYELSFIVFDMFQFFLRFSTFLTSPWFLGNLYPFRLFLRYNLD